MCQTLLIHRHYSPHHHPTPQHRPASYSHPLPPPPPYVPPAAPPPQRQGGDLGQDQSERTMVMTTALVCLCCKRGLVPEDIASYCRTRGGGFSLWTAAAWGPHAHTVRLSSSSCRTPNLLGTKAIKKCNRCWRSIKKVSATWHCDKSLDPELHAN